MKQGIQAEFKGINNDIYEYGCYFLDLVEWGWRVSGKKITETEDVLRIYEQCSALDYIRTECYVNNAAGIFNLAAGRAVHQGVRKTREVPDGVKSYIICNKKPMYTHFTLCYKGEIWDSLPPDRMGAAAYKPDSYRILV